MSDDYYDELIWKALCNHEQFQGGKHRKELEDYLKWVVEDVRNLQKTACGWKKILWKNAPVFIDVEDHDETCSFTDGFHNIVSVDGIEVNFANLCTCDFFALSNAKLKKCPECDSKLEVARLGSEEYEWTSECINCGYVQKNRATDVCEDCGCDSLELKRGRQIGKTATIEYTDIFIPPAEIDMPFFSALLKLFLVVELYIKKELDIDDLNEQWMKLYKMILKRDLKMAQEGNIKKMVEQICRKYSI